MNRVEARNETGRNNCHTNQIFKYTFSRKNILKIHIRTLRGNVAIFCCGVALIQLEMAIRRESPQEDKSIPVNCGR